MKFPTLLAGVGIFIWDVYRAKPDSDMKRSGMELKHGSQ